MSAFKTLDTPFETNSYDAWKIYPRPQLVRDSFFSLCGIWQLSVGKNGSEEPLGDITVPFPPESRLSGISRTLSEKEVYYYDRVFSLPDDFLKNRLLLHFGAVDQVARVYINGSFIGEHTGGYLPFALDVTKAVLPEAENHIRVEVHDPLDTDLPYGKQRTDRGGMWYTPISGIWQPVWMESVPENYVTSLKITPTERSVELFIEGGNGENTLILETERGEKKYSFSGNSFTLEIDEPHLWSPEDPYLYSFTVKSGEDVVRSYFALRTISVVKKKNRSYLALNGKPYFFHGLLDQGYFPDGIYLPASPEGYLWDIKTMKGLGFNMLRKHIKIEPDLFYYYCDKCGMIVFQDMVNSGKYSFLLDTALPTVGLKRGIRHSASSKRREQFERDCRDTVKILYNHPSLVYYTIFNEGWGQYDADRIYEDMKEIDPTRIWDATSGWFKEKMSDVVSDHVYFKKLKLKADPERPLVLSEFGGYSCNIPGHIFNEKSQYGYKSFSSPEELTDGLAKLYMDQVIPMIRREGLSASVLTQVSDVEDETNGLVTYDRQVVKCKENTMVELSHSLFKAFEDSISQC